MITLTERVVKSFEVSELVSSKTLLQTQEVLETEFKPMYCTAPPPGQHSHTKGQSWTTLV